MLNYSRRHYLKLFTVPFRSNYTSRQQLYDKCYNILGVNESTDQNSVRSAYIALVKIYHPDSGKEEASKEKFLQIDEAFKILQEKYAKERRGIQIDMDEQVKIFDIKHTAPQHRQYLSFDGVGFGTPAQREKQYQTRRAMKAQEKVLEHRVQKAQGEAAEKAVIKKGSFFKSHAIKTKYGFDRVVEDLIQEAMSKGDFTNLKGVGKPLPDHQAQNPYVDFTTHKMNKILMDNGFTPEWIMLQKEIRDSVEAIRKSLFSYRVKHRLHPPIFEADKSNWLKMVGTQRDAVSDINKRIDKFNLIVPIMDKQLVHIELDMLADKVLQYIEFDGESVPVAGTSSPPPDANTHNRSASNSQQAEVVIQSQSDNILTYLSKVFH